MKSLIQKLKSTWYWWLFRYSPRILAKLLRGHYEVALPYHEGIRDVDEQKLLLEPETFEVPEFTPEGEMNAHWNPPWYYRKLVRNNVSLAKTKTTFIFPEGVLVSKWGISERQLIYPSEKNTLTAFYILRKRIEAIKVKRLETALLLHDRWSYTNYYHWILECLTKYVLWLDSKHQGSVPLVLPLNASDFIFKSIRLLNPEQEIILLPQNELIYAQSCFIIDQFYTHPNAIRLMIKRVMLSLAPCSSSNFGKKIYISRKNATARRIVNEENLVKVLSHFGIVAVEFELLTFEEQVRLCSNATLLIGTHGAGLTNGLFMPEGSVVVEITSTENLKPPIDRYCYYTLLSSMGMEYKTFLAQTKEHSQVQSDLTVDVVKFSALLAKMTDRHF